MKKRKLKFQEFLGKMFRNIIQSQKVSKMVGSFFLLFFVAGFLLAPLHGVSALMAVQVGDNLGLQDSMKNAVANSVNWAEDKWDTAYEWFTKEAMAIAAWTAYTTAINTIAYDTATYLASGDKGQKPMFMTEGWGDFLRNTADNTAGQMLEDLGEEGAFGEKFNLCNPNFGVQLKIGLGLVQYEKPEPPACTFTKMKENWQEALDSDTFLNDFQDMFNPTSNDLGAALTVRTGIIEAKKLKVGDATKKREESGGWLDVYGPAGERYSPPGEAESTSEQAKRIREMGFMRATENGFQDAVNIFANQFALTAFNRLLAKLGEDKPSYTNPYDGDYGGFTDYEAGPYVTGSEGAREEFLEIMNPEFIVRGDYDILAELSMCPDPSHAGPTNCVINDKFSEAIISKLTVGEAMKGGFLNPNGVFGFGAEGGEPSYMEGFPYRSMMILRKFRIIPVGWEIAAEYILDNSIQVGGVKNLQYLVYCFSKTDSYGDTTTPDWCEGLVDPDWVLKAPLNYCKREGPGSFILSETVSGNEDFSFLTVARDAGYCADEQSCIKENYDGSCQFYGYCTEEKRKWNFGSDSCDPVFNTCSTFRGSDGNTVSLLMNTVNYGVCGVDNVGCSAYCDDYNFSNDTFDCSDVVGDKVFLDNDSEECDPDSEGCREFIRTKPGLGSNLFNNSSFEQMSVGWTQLCDFNASYGDCSAQLIVDVLPIDVPLFDGSTTPLGGEYFTLSLFAKDCGTAGYLGVGSENWATDDYATSTLVTSDTWSRFSVTHLIGGGNRIQIALGDLDFAGDCRIDAVKVERGDKATTYSDYRDNGLVYEKIIPPYLEGECYEANNDFRLKNGHPLECEIFARKCNQDELGCEMFTSVEDNMSIPAKLAVDDYCPVECVGYNDYLETETNFETKGVKYFIPAFAETCGAEAAGCDAFTNLDKVSAAGETETGAEDVEYYTYLRQCVELDEPDCREFLTWEGGSETGFQLRYFSLLMDGGSADPFPMTYASVYRNLFCNEDTYDLVNNPMCREFYNENGDIFYKFINYTLSCSDNCHPFRRASVDSDNSITTQATCGLGNLCNNAASDGDGACWDNVKSVCNTCLNGGTWNSNQGACMYMAIPEEGRRCDASQDGCREYTGNTGNNTRIVFRDNFESGSVSAWTGNIDINNPSKTSLMAGESSLLISGVGNLIASTSLGYRLQIDRSYSLSFVAKGAGANTFTRMGLGLNIDDSIKFSLGVGGSVMNNDWQLFEFNLANFNNANNNYALSNEDGLIIEADGDFYIDNIQLTEITDRYYLIDTSLNIPESCNKDVFGNTASELYNLGCARYTDRANVGYSLRKFSSLCQDSAVGCELMVDTNNYAEFDNEVWNDGGAGICLPGDIDCVEIEGDELIYAVYDEKMNCAASDLGCQLFGDPYQYGTDLFYTAAYLKNNPNHYSEILCSEDEENCEAWSTEDGIEHFVDPGEEVCEWRMGSAGVGVLNWWKKSVKRCDDTGTGGLLNGLIEKFSEQNVCLSDSDCAGTGVICENGEDCRQNLCVSEECTNTSNTCVRDEDCPLLLNCLAGECNYICMVDKNDYNCDLAPYPNKTIGYGGEGLKIKTPGSDWAGVCPISSAGCTEYIDPISDFSVNKIFNGDFSQDVDGVPGADGWTAQVNGEQEIVLDPNTLYIISIDDASLIDGANRITLRSKDVTKDIFNQFSPDSSLINNFDLSDLSTVSVDSVAESRASLMVYTNDLAADTAVIVRMFSASSPNSSKVAVKKAIIDYQLKQDVDTESCDLVNRDVGCVLFNERSVTGALATAISYENLLFDADKSPNANGVGEACAGLGCDSNRLIKVDPDRVCKEWLSCRSMLKDSKGRSTCFDIGSCDSLNENGICDHFVVKSDLYNQEITFLDDPSPYSNMTGYSKVGLSKATETEMKGLLPVNEMKQIGEIILVSNGSFEQIGINDYPLGWGMDIETEPWSRSYFRTLSNPVEIQAEGIDKAPDGKAILMAGSSHPIASDYIDVTPGQDLVLSVNINTKNLNNAALVEIHYYRPNGNEVGAFDTLSLSPNKDWTFVSKQLGVNTNANKIRLIIRTVGDGNFYIDDVKIRPALLVSSDLSDDYKPQTCRLYPSNDALSCDYLAEAGNQMKGWWGYCLEHDRYPGDSDTCLTWWPVDRVKGDGVSDTGNYRSYNGKFPLYYCKNLDANFVFVETREEKLLKHHKKNINSGIANFISDLNWFEAVIGTSVFKIGDPSFHGRSNVCPAEYHSNGTFDETSNESVENGGYYMWSYSYTTGHSITMDKTRHTKTYCTPTGDPIIENWYEYNGNLVKWDGLTDGGFDETIMGVMIYDYSTGRLVDPDTFILKCGSIVQTVNSMGQNKVWGGRVFPGSEYTTKVDPNTVSESLYSYEADSLPFGAVTPPEPANNPYEWDGLDEPGVQPLTFLSSNTGSSRAGSPYKVIGASAGALGLCEVSGDACLQMSTNIPRGLTVKCDEDNNADGVIDDADRTAPCYVNYEKTIMNCPGIERCDTTMMNTSNITTPPEDNLKRLFAKSYGTWGWTNKKGYCGNTPATACELKEDQCPNGSECEKRCIMTTGAGGSLRKVYNYVNNNSADDGNIIEYGPCTDDASCSGILYDGHNAGWYNANNICSTYAAICSVTANCVAAECCTLGVNGCVQAQITACTNEIIAAKLDVSVSFCSVTRTPCANQADCNFSASCKYDKCVGGDNDGKGCNEAQKCVNDNCVMNLTDPGRYEVSAFPDWDVPGVLCVGGVRPVGVFTGNDYCAVLPVVSNIIVDKNNAMAGFAVKINKSRLVELTFNSDVDVNQMPLVSYTIDWGDEEKTVVSGAEMYDKSNVDDPHAMSHIYDYWDLRNKKTMDPSSQIICADFGGALGATGFSCPFETDCCAVKPRVRLKDNWGWCTGGSNASMCPADTVLGAFEEYGGYVVVSER